MCGICGIAGGGEVRQETVEAMAATMCHRGPDDHGSWISQARDVGFAHRRLSIIDLSQAGHQPMLSAGKDVSITFNGEIYNFRELRVELTELGHHFTSGSDTEVILASYAEWGLDSVTHLNGMFAFAIHDQQRQRLFLARDRAGEKPLFYRHERGAFRFASELKALLAEPGASARVDPAALNQYLAFGYVIGDGCIVQGVRKLPQASALTYHVRTSELHVWKYWDLPPAITTAGASEGELLEELDRLLSDSVRMRMIADVPVGIMLSGGIDSSLITAMAARVSPGSVRTFSISFPGHGSLDESQHARTVASHFGTRHTELAAEPESVELLPLLAGQYDEPIADSSMVPTFVLAKLIRPEATVALGGDGGDELFGGYYHHDWGRRQQFVQKAVPPLLRPAVSRAARRLPARIRGRDYLIGADTPIDLGLARLNLYFGLEDRRRLLVSPRMVVDEAPEYLKASLAFGETPAQRSMAMDFRSYLVDDILVKVDRASMLTSLEVRSPFLDHRIIEFAFGKLPDRYRTGRGERKVLLKALARRLLPSELDLQRKQGFSLPLSRWFKGDWGPYMRSVVKGMDSSVFSQPFIAELLGETGAEPIPHMIFSLMMFELWRRHYHVSL